jgi:hypothetical protein
MAWRRLRLERRRPAGFWWLVTVVVASLILALAWLVTGRVTEPIDSYAECVAAGHPVLESSPPICRAGGHNFRGPISSPEPSSEAVESQPFKLLVDGSSPGQYPRRQEVIRTQAQWEQYWRLVHTGAATPPLLPVDFATQHVVALSLGRQVTGGYDIKVAGITTSRSGTVIDVTEIATAPGCPVHSAPQTNPYFIVQTAHLPEPVSFRITAGQRTCKS